MLKQEIVQVVSSYQVQPPSGGCVLKQEIEISVRNEMAAAAFGRLCVETIELVQARMMIDGSRLRAAVC